MLKILIFFQIGIGAFVSGMDAGNIYNSWPLMGNAYFPDDNDINSLNMMGLNINPEDIFDPTTAAQKARLGLNILRAFTDAAQFGTSDFIFKGLSKNTTYFPEFTGASNIKFRGKTIPKIADWNRLFKAMAGKNYASQYFTPDLGTALKYGGEGGSIVAIPRTPGVRGWKNCCLLYTSDAADE